MDKVGERVRRALKEAAPILEARLLEAIRKDS